VVQFSVNMWFTFELTYTTGRIYDQKQGLDYLQRKIKEFESEQEL